MERCSSGERSSHIREIKCAICVFDTQTPNIHRSQSTCTMCVCVCVGFVGVSLHLRCVLVACACKFCGNHRMLEIFVDFSRFFCAALQTYAIICLRQTNASGCRRIGTVCVCVFGLLFYDWHARVYGYTRLVACVCHVLWLGCVARTTTALSADKNIRI